MKENSKMKPKMKRNLNELLKCF